jgi:hypothetical protein
LKPLVPDEFDVPEVLESDEFRLRMLTIHDVIKDYDAVMTSGTHLRKTFAYASQHSVFGEGWPPEDLTLVDDLVDLGWHQAEFKKRSSFTFTVMSKDESQCVGCVYILPPERAEADTEVYMWVRKSAYDKGLDEKLFKSVKAWLEEAWPFARIAYPGRQ